MTLIRDETSAVMLHPYIMTTLLTQLLVSLGCLHNCSIMKRDLKPSNVRLYADADVIVRSGCIPSL